MLSATIPYSQPLSDGLILKSIAGAADVERLATFNGHIHGAEVAAMTRNLILHHPHTRPEHWLYVEDSTSGRIVSSLCLLPWRWRCDGIELRAGEMGICGTLEEYRNRGLVRQLMVRHRALLNEGEYHLSHIQGIPYFYRQFGYEYAVPLVGGWQLQFAQVPALVSNPYTLRRAGIADVEALMALYDAASSELGISARRDVDEWHYILTHSLETATALELWLLIDGQGRPAGYCGINHYGFSEGLIVAETSHLTSAAAHALLDHLKRLAVERSKPYLHLLPPDNSGLVRLAAAWGAREEGRYAWQINVPDVPRLLRRLAPVLERRLAASPFADLNGVVTLDLYKGRINLRFSMGKLLHVDAMPVEKAETAVDGEVRLPPLQIAPLVLGWRTSTDLQSIYPDFNIWGSMRYLIDVLFPKMDSYLYSVY